MNDNLESDLAKTYESAAYRAFNEKDFELAAEYVLKSNIGAIESGQPLPYSDKLRTMQKNAAFMALYFNKLGQHLLVETLTAAEQNKLIQLADLLKLTHHSFSQAYAFLNSSGLDAQVSSQIKGHLLQSYDALGKYDAEGYLEDHFEDEDELELEPTNPDLYDYATKCFFKYNYSKEIH